MQWFSCREVVNGKLTTFTYLSSLAVDHQLVVELTASGRMRWKIENEGFNIQKHHGYGLGHQFSRTSMRAMKNYYQLMQIGHMINQLLELSTWFRALCTRHITVMYLWDCLVKRLSEAHLDIAAGMARLTGRLQCRYDEGVWRRPAPKFGETFDDKSKEDAWGAHIIKKKTEHTSGIRSWCMTEAECQSYIFPTDTRLSKKNSLNT